MSKRIYNVVRPREGTDGRTFWDRHGILVINGDKVSIKLESIPAGEWNGWFNCFQPREDQAQPYNAPIQPMAESDFDDDVPF